MSAAGTIEAAGELALRALAPGIGAEVLGVDLSHPLAPLRQAAIRRAWLDHGILLFRDQKLSEIDQVRFAAGFGRVSERVVNRHDGTSPTHPGVMFISNIRENGRPIGALPDGEMMFHSDQCYLAEPCMASMLYAIEVPAHGGNTLFGNLYRAFDSLPAELKASLAGRRAVNVYDYSANPTRRPSSGSAIRQSAAGPEVAAEGGLTAVHPVFRTHPETRRKALYVNRLMTERIEGMERDESDRVLERLFQAVEDPRWIYEHVWRPGDLLLWDNRCTVHARTDFAGTERRLMRRCVVLGDAPFE